MNLKKLSVVFIGITACALFFSGCSTQQEAENTEPTATESVVSLDNKVYDEAENTGPTATENVVSLDNKVYDEENEKIPVTNADEFAAWIAGYINLENYDEPYRTNEYIGYTHVNWLDRDSNIEPQIFFSDGSSLTFPTTHDQVVSQGWTTDKDIHEEIPALKGIFGAYQNSRGQTIYLASSNKTEKPIAFQDGEIDSMRIYNFRVDDNGMLIKDDNGTPIKDKNAAEFILSKEITNASSIQEIISVLGEPDRVSYDPDDDISKTSAINLWYGRFLINVSVPDNEIISVYL